MFLVGKNTWKTDRTFVFKVGTSVDVGAIIGDARMKKMQGNMWINEHKYELKELLRKVPENNWNWYIYEFNGVGTAPNNLDMPSFEEMVLSLDTGYLISWSDLKELAYSLDDIDTFLAVASSGVNSYDKIRSHDFVDFFCKIDLFDSSSWEIIINN